MSERSEAEPSVEEVTQSLRGSVLGRLVDARSPYVLVRFAMLRLLGLVYLMAFIVTLEQGVALIGEDGLLPVPTFLERVLVISGSNAAAFGRLPTLFWLGYSDALLLVFGWLGAALSVAVLFGVENAAVQLVLWLLYLSIAQVGQRFYGYGWESQLLESGFLSVFLCPLRTLRPLRSPPPFATILLFRWLIFRIMLGAGLIKIRGDDCWRNLTCLIYHYETQPNPHPLSFWLHFLPPWAHKIGVAFNHLVELVAPWLAFGPRRARLVAGALFVMFQVTLILSGNLSFLNWLTIVPALACFDDDALARLLPRKVRERVRGRLGNVPLEPPTLHQKVAWGYAFIVMLLSVGPVLNLFSKRQAMNLSFDPLRLVNTYGAFGSVTRVRHEVVLSGTRDGEIGPSTEWEEYEFPCKPGSVTRPPCWITPYHYRLDWQMWFAAFRPVRGEPWIIHFTEKLLRADPAVLSLLSHDPFGGKPPRFIRAELYEYEMVSPLSDDPRWWRRKRAGMYLPPVSLGDEALQEFLRQYGWQGRH